MSQENWECELNQKCGVFDNTFGIFKYLIYAGTQRFWTKVLVFTHLNEQVS